MSEEDPKTHTCCWCQSAMDPHDAMCCDCWEQNLRSREVQRDHALDDLKAEIANHREDTAAMVDLRARVVELEAQLDELRKDIAEWHPVQECSEEIHKLRTALERIRDEFDFSWDHGDPAPLRQIAIDALGVSPEINF